jgi:hypothetical protein
MADTYALLGTELKTFPGSYYGYSNLDDTLDASGEKAAVIFQVPGACDLTGATAFCSGVASPPTYKFTLQAVDAAGDPDGVVLATTAEFTPSASTAEQHSFTSAYTATQGQVLALVLEYGSGTISASNDATFRNRTVYAKYNLFPFYSGYNGSSWSGDNDAYPVMTVQTDEDWDTGGIFNTAAAATFGPSSNAGERYTQKMLIPSGENIELHIIGFEFSGRVLNDTSAPADGPYKAGIWNAAGTALASVSIDPDQQAAFPMQAKYSRDILFTSTATCTDNVAYYLGFEHLADALNVGCSTPGSAAGLKSWPAGDIFYAATFDQFGTITEDKSKRLLLNPILSSWHGTASGGGGSTTRPTMGVIG